MAERIGLEPMDRYSRSQISNLLHYHSANAPRCELYMTSLVMQAEKYLHSRHDFYIMRL